jgi:hypothetical protein
MATIDCPGASVTRRHLRKHLPPPPSQPTFASCRSKTRLARWAGLAGLTAGVLGNFWAVCLWQKLSANGPCCTGQTGHPRPRILSGEINGLRFNYAMAMIPGERREFGTCDVEIADRKMNRARRFGATLPGYTSNRSLFEAWDREEPVDTWECERDRRIASLQGHHNPFVLQQCPG